MALHSNLCDWEIGGSEEWRDMITGKKIFTMMSFAKI